MLFAPIPFSADTPNYDLQVPAQPAQCSNWLGTDDQGRDVLARVMYGTRVSMLFAFALTVISVLIGVPPAPCRAITAAGSTCSASACWRCGRGCRCCTC
jgi:ABC-type microcin C transport system permease subunit YejE